LQEQMDTSNNLQFSRSSDGTLLIRFAGDWKLSNKLRESLITESMTAQTYDAKVAAMSGALEKLSRDIAEGIKGVLQKNK
jgi:hypothetical protein